MKTKEKVIPFYCEPDDLDYFINKTGDAMLRVYKNVEQTSSNRTIAKLVIEIPEKKVTITESEFMNCVVKYCHSRPEVKTLNEMMERFKVDLFGD